MSELHRHDQELTRRNFLRMSALIAASAITPASAPIAEQLNLDVPTEQLHPELAGAHIIQDPRENTTNNSSVFEIPEKAFPSAEEWSRFPKDISDRLDQHRKHFNRMLHRGHSMTSIVFSRVKPSPKDSSLPRYRAESDINNGQVGFTMRPEVDYSYKEIEQTIFHEAIHRLNKQSGSDDGPTATNSTNTKQFTHWIFGNSPRGLETDYDNQVTGATDLQIAGLWALLDESSYTKTTSDKGFTNGHPYDSSEELLASTLTVLRYYPRSFIASIKTLPPGTRKKVLEFVSTAYRESNANSASQLAFSNLFSPVIKKYLGVND